MKISTVLDHIDNGHIALPQFQRGYVWTRAQVRGLFSSLYRGYPIGSLLVWSTSSGNAEHRGDGTIAAGIVKLLLDGQQRMTSVYGVVRGRPPAFFDGNPSAFTDLCFHLEDEEFEFYQPIKMRDDLLWVKVTDLMNSDQWITSEWFASLTKNPSTSPHVGKYVDRVATLKRCIEREMHVEDVIGKDKTLDIVVEIFNRVNSGGTWLSHGDLAMAKVSADWPEARDTMRTMLGTYREAGYRFDLDWLLRSVNTVLTGKAKFSHLHDVGQKKFKDALKRAGKQIDVALSLIRDRLGQDQYQALFSVATFPVMVRFLDRSAGPLGIKGQDKLLFWYVQSGMWGRFSSSSETAMDKSIGALEKGGLDGLIADLRTWRGSLSVKPEHFDAWGRGARFYRLLYTLTYMIGARDFLHGTAVVGPGVGAMSRLEVHHIFPKSQLYKRGHNKVVVNTLANLCFLTRDTNQRLSNRLPEEYFEEAESMHPGALASQCIPMDRTLWKVENCIDFFEERRRLLAKHANRCLETLLHGDRLLRPDSTTVVPTTGSAEERPAPVTVSSEAKSDLAGGLSTEEEGERVKALNTWMARYGLQKGTIEYECSDAYTGEPLAVLDIAWPEGIQPGLTSPVAVLLNEPGDVIAAASGAGFRCFTSDFDFKNHVRREILW